MAEWRVEKMVVEMVVAWAVLMARHWVVEKVGW